jgi:serine acetyltransferase
VIQVDRCFGAISALRLLIDHETGVVIGETTQIGGDCVTFHNRTFGGTGIVPIEFPFEKSPQLAAIVIWVSQFVRSGEG